MAVNQTAVALNTCTKIVDATNRLLDALDDLESIAEQLNKASVDLSAYDAQIATGSGISQALGSTYLIIAKEVEPEIVSCVEGFHVRWSANSERLDCTSESETMKSEGCPLCEHEITDANGGDWLRHVFAYHSPPVVNQPVQWAQATTCCYCQRMFTDGTTHLHHIAKCERRKVESQ